MKSGESPPGRDGGARTPPADSFRPPAPDEVLDTVGFYCPVPIIKTAATIREMEEGQVLEVLSDDRVVLVDMPAWCRSTGNQYLGHVSRGGELHLFVRKSGRSRSRPAG